MKKRFFVICIILLSLTWLSACQPTAGASPEGRTNLTGARVQVLAVEPFLADIAQNVAGERLSVDVLIPAGLDPHSFEPAPQDLAKISDSQVLIVNGAGLEEWLEETLQNAGGERRVIEASAGLASRDTGEEEATAGETAALDAHAVEGDPHFWLDPNYGIDYVENIREGFISVDPEGKEIYTQNAAAYTEKLRELDGWIQAQVSEIPPERRLLVTNHESFGYFADRYGFKVIGTILPGPSSLASPSAQKVAALVEEIRRTGAPAVFLETGSNPQLAQGIGRETGIKVVTGLYTHSLSAPGGEAPGYIEMIKYNTRMFVEALQ